MKTGLILSIFLLVTSSVLATPETFDQAILKKVFIVEPTTKNQKKLHEASTLLISCVDFRLRDETLKLMEDQLHLKNNYDEIALAGAALAYVADDFPQWRKTMDDLIGLLQDLHHIKQVIFLDHYGCGAYKKIHGDTHTKSQKAERDLHKETFKKVRAEMKKRYPKLKVYTFIMDLDGNVENIKEEI
jgi:carbonic anhydrase